MKGDPGKRPIDTLIQNFYEVYQSLVLAATNPSQADRANANLQMQVVNLRANASRLPRPVARMVNAAVDDFEGDAASNSLAQLNQMLNSTVTRTCEQVIANRYPFAQGQRARRADAGLRPPLRAERRDRPLLCPEPRADGRHERQGLGLEGGHAARPRTVEDHAARSSSAPPRSATPSSRRAARCRRSV